MSSWEIFVEAKLYCTHLETRTFWGFTLKVHFIEFLLYSEKSVINFFPVKIKGLILYWADHLSQGSGHLWRVFRVREQQLELQVYSQCAVDKMPQKLIYLVLSTWPALKLFFFQYLLILYFRCEFWQLYGLGLQKRHPICVCVWAARHRALWIFTPWDTDQTNLHRDHACS